MVEQTGGQQAKSAGENRIPSDAKVEYVQRGLQAVGVPVPVFDSEGKRKNDQWYLGYALHAGSLDLSEVRAKLQHGKYTRSDGYQLGSLLPRENPDSFSQDISHILVTMQMTVEELRKQIQSHHRHWEAYDIIAKQGLEDLPSDDPVELIFRLKQGSWKDTAWELWRSPQQTEYSYKNKKSFTAHPYDFIYHPSLEGSELRKEGLGDIPYGYKLSGNIEIGKPIQLAYEGGGDPIPLGNVTDVVIVTKKALGDFTSAEAKDFIDSHAISTTDLHYQHLTPNPPEEAVVLAPDYSPDKNPFIQPELNHTPEDEWELIHDETLRRIGHLGLNMLNAFVFKDALHKQVPRIDNEPKEPITAQTDFRHAHLKQKTVQEQIFNEYLSWYISKINTATPIDPAKKLYAYPQGSEHLRAVLTDLAEKLRIKPQVSIDDVLAMVEYFLTRPRLQGFPHDDLIDTVTLDHRLSKTVEVNGNQLVVVRAEKDPTRLEKKEIVIRPSSMAVNTNVLYTVSSPEFPVTVSGITTFIAGSKAIVGKRVVSYVYEGYSTYDASGRLIRPQIVEEEGRLDKPPVIEVDNFATLAGPNSGTKIYQSEIHAKNISLDCAALGKAVKIIGDGTSGAELTLAYNVGYADEISGFEHGTVNFISGQIGKDLHTETFHIKGNIPTRPLREGYIGATIRCDTCIIDGNAGLPQMKKGKIVCKNLIISPPLTKQDVERKMIIEFEQ